MQHVLVHSFNLTGFVCLFALPLVALLMILSCKGTFPPQLSALPLSACGHSSQMWPFNALKLIRHDRMRLIYLRS